MWVFLQKQRQGLQNLRVKSKDGCCELNWICANNVMEWFLIVWWIFYLFINDILQTVNKLL